MFTRKPVIIAFNLPVPKWKAIPRPKAPKIPKLPFRIRIERTKD